MPSTIMRTAIVTVALSLAACGGGGEAGGGGDKGQPTRLGVQLKEFTVVLGKTSVAAGRIRAVGGNVGAVAHMVVIIKTDLAPDALPVKGNVVDEKGAGLTVVGKIDPIAPKGVERKVFPVEAGKHVLICNVPTHYQQGMRAALTVT